MKTLSAGSRTHHDHDRCIAKALKAAEEICEQREIQFTPIRRRVLELVWREHAPIGAYEILRALKKGEGALAPPTVYRALDFLLTAGLIHRVDALNAFIGCETPYSTHAGQLLICTSCHRVEELDDPAITRFLRRKAKAAAFTPSAQHVEIKGICDECMTRH